MSHVVIENPIINSPTAEPTRHFRFTDEGIIDEGITDEIVDGRRTSSYFVPIARPKKKGSKQLQFDTEWTQDRIEENKLVNDIRRRGRAHHRAAQTGTVIDLHRYGGARPRSRGLARNGPQDAPGGHAGRFDTRAYPITIAERCCQSL